MVSRKDDGNGCHNWWIKYGVCDKGGKYAKQPKQETLQSGKLQDTMKKGSTWR